MCACALCPTLKIVGSFSHPATFCRTSHRCPSCTHTAGSNVIRLGEFSAYIFYGERNVKQMFDDTLAYENTPRRCKAIANLPTRCEVSCHGIVPCLRAWECLIFVDFPTTALGGVSGTRLPWIGSDYLAQFFFTLFTDHRAVAVAGTRDCVVVLREKTPFQDWLAELCLHQGWTTLALQNGDIYMWRMLGVSEIMWKYFYDVIYLYMLKQKYMIW